MLRSGLVNSDWRCQFRAFCSCHRRTYYDSPCGEEDFINQGLLCRNFEHLGVHIAFDRTRTYPAYRRGLHSSWGLVRFLVWIYWTLRADMEYRCWIGSAWEHDRLYLHYLWIFMAQLGSLAIYIYIFFHLRLRAKELNHRRFSLPSTASSNNTKRLTGHGPQAANQIVISSFHGDDPFTNSRKKLQRTARTMVVYPVAYIILTLPLAIGRVAAMAGKELSLVYFCVAGTMMATCGVMDVLLYLSTRKAIIKSELGGRLSNNNSGGMQSSHDPSVLDPVNYRVSQPSSLLQPQKQDPYS